MKRTTTFAFLALSLSAASAVLADGYKDTPLLPGGKWHVHDPDRPKPPKVDPGPSPKKPAKPPKDAIVLFDGKDLSKWKNQGWKLENGYMIEGRGNQATKESFGDCWLHVEWSEPLGTEGHGQERGNSGVFLMDRFEIQVLDSAGTETYADGQASALYGQNPPRVNATRKPGEWNVYDILFHAPRFKEGKLESPATVTVIHNGFVTQNNVTALGPTGHRILANYNDPIPAKAPISLQDHGNAVRFRNIWVLPLDSAE